MEKLPLKAVYVLQNIDWDKSEAHPLQTQKTVIKGIFSLEYSACLAK